VNPSHGASKTAHSSKGRMKLVLIVFIFGFALFIAYGLEMRYRLGANTLSEDDRDALQPIF
jgi:hypothetical protein